MIYYNTFEQDCILVFKAKDKTDIPPKTNTL